MQRGWDAKGKLTPLYAKVGGVDKLAELSGSPRSSLAAINSGKRKLGPGLAARIAEAADVSLEDLMGTPTGTSPDEMESMRVRLAELEALVDRQQTTIAVLQKTVGLHESMLAAAGAMTRHTASPLVQATADP